MTGAGDHLDREATGLDHVTTMDSLRSVPELRIQGGNGCGGELGEGTRTLRVILVAMGQEDLTHPGTIDRTSDRLEMGRSIRTRVYDHTGG